MCRSLRPTDGWDGQREVADGRESVYLFNQGVHLVLSYQPTAHTKPRCRPRPTSRPPSVPNGVGGRVLVAAVWVGRGKTPAEPSAGGQWHDVRRAHEAGRRHISLTWSTFSWAARPSVITSRSRLATP